MTSQQRKNAALEQQKIYSGILFNNRIFAPGEKKQIRYTLNCPEFGILRERYELEKIAGKGTDFARAGRLMHYLAPRLTHCSWYDNHVPCNALDLLSYSLNQPEQGINCLNKSKILEECCLSLGIYARRVGIYPYSPYDFDNHVVVEIFDRGMNKWIMLDPTTDGFFMDEAGNPLSLLEMRQRFAYDLPVTFAPSAARKREYGKLKEKHSITNAYICKNLFYLLVDARCGFGELEERLIICPEHYSVRENQIQNLRYRLANIPEAYAGMIPAFRARLETVEKSAEREYTDVSCMTMSPLETK